MESCESGDRIARLGGGARHLMMGLRPFGIKTEMWERSLSFHTLSPLIPIPCQVLC